MLKRIIYTLLTSLSYLPHTFATYDLQDYYTSEQVGIFSPIGRLGFNGSIKTISLTKVRPGPSDEHFSLAPSAITPVAKNHMAFTMDTTYIFGSPGQEQCYSSPYQIQVKERISTYGTARLTFDSYQEQCKRLGLANLLAPLRITLNPYDQICLVGPSNAYYQRTGTNGGQGVIEFCSRGLSTARIFDIVAHETGHGILDTLRPGFLVNSDTHPYKALHESFGDLSALFASIRLAKFTNPSAIPNFLENGNFCLAPGLSTAGTCLRNSATYSGTSCKAHDHSNYLTDFVIRSMRGTFNQLEYSTFNAKWTSDFFQGLLTYTVINAGGFNSLGDFGLLMIGNVETLLQKNYHLSPLINEVMQRAYDSSPLSTNSCALPYRSLLRYPAA